MSRSVLRRSIFVVLLCITLGALPARAAEPHGAASGQEPWYAWLLEAAASLWGDNGCSADPYGGCAAVAVQSDNGCHPDPYGGCAAATVQSDNGCWPDPFGGCGE